MKRLLSVVLAMAMVLSLFAVGASALGFRELRNADERSGRLSSLLPSREEAAPAAALTPSAVESLWNSEPNSAVGDFYTKVMEIAIAYNAWMIQLSWQDLDRLWDLFEDLYYFR